MKVFRLLTIGLLLASGLVAAASAPAGAAVTRWRVASMTAADAAVTPWHVASYFSRLGTQVNRVSCTPTGHCTAITPGRLLATANGGTSWTDETPSVPADAAALTDVACPTDTRCYVSAVLGDGTSVVYRVDRGAVTTTSAVGADATLTSIDCTSADVCFTSEGHHLFRTGDGAATWTAQALPQTLATTAEYAEPLTGRSLAVSCAPGTETCVVAGNVLAPVEVVAESTPDGGQSWSASPTVLHAGSRGSVSVDCLTATRCYAATMPADTYYPTMSSTVDGGATSTSRAQQYALGSESVLSCGAIDACGITGSPAAGLVGAAYPAVTFTANFRRWANHQYVPATLNGPAIACTSALACLLVSDGAAVKFIKRGQASTTVELPSARRAVSQLSCPTVNRCVGIGAGDWKHPLVVASGAPTGPWVSDDLPTAPNEVLETLECPTAQACYATGYPFVTNGSDPPTQALHSADGGRTWTSVDLSGVLLTDLACTSAATCLGSSDTIARMRRTTDAGATWVTVTPPAQFDATKLFSTACSPSTTCIVSGQLHNDGATQLYRTTDFAATWSAQPLAFAGDFADCNGSLCVMTGDTRQRTTVAVSADSGVTWTLVVVPDVRQLRAVSCGSPTACGISAVDRNGVPVVVSTHDAGTSWQVHTLPALATTPRTSTISCQRTVCFLAAVDAYGRPTLFTGSA